MIFKRFIASQMKEVRLLYQKFSVELDGNRVSMENPISLVSDGFNLVLLVKIANPVEEGEYAVIFARLLTVPVARPFTQCELIFLMRERGIGRPSTYKIISRILEVVRLRPGEQANQHTSGLQGLHVSALELETTPLRRRRGGSNRRWFEQGKADYNEILRDLYGEILEIKRVA
jgi:reverse gyrase